MIRSVGLRVAQVRQVGQRSGWLKLQESQGRRVGLGVRFLWWLYDTASLKKEYLVVRAEKP
jgi:hypothetical protein